MALHRDILWIGKQWAVTGHGMQLIDQRLMGAFDIELARLWDDDLVEHMHARPWLNAADFDSGLAVARARHNRPEAGSETLAVMAPTVETIVEPPPQLQQPPAELAKQASPDLQMKTDGGARFARPWRVWLKKT
jgi:hypothetical protein